MSGARRDAAHGLAALALLGLAACGASEAPRPPVVLVVIDTLRADRTGMYGHTRATTPHLDRLAADAVRFEAARSHAPWTTPSVAALLSSRHPSALGIHDIGDRVPPDAPWLPEALRRAGYATGAVVSHSFVAERWGFDRGFDAFDASPVAGQRAVTSAAVTDAAIDFVDAHAGRPFFLFAHYFDPHFALIDHPEFGFRDPGPPYTGRVRSPVPFLVFGRADAGVTPREAREMLRIYDAEVAHTDQEVGRLLDHLRARGLYAPALVVLTADHGEEFLEHGRIGHTRTLYDELLRVPLVVKLPGATPRTEPRPVGLVDVFPTLLDALDLPAPPGLAGRSLLAPPDPARPVFAETSRQARLRAVVVGDEKLVRDLSTGRDRLFDLSEDPAERRDLASARPRRAAELGRLLDAWLARSGRRGPALPPVRVDAAERERLRALGYGE